MSKMLKKYNKIITFLLIVFLPLLSFAEADFSFVKSTDINNGWYSTIDNSENVYYTGSFSGTVDFDPGAGTTNLTATGSYDVFVSKLDTDGSFVWAKSFAGSSSAFSQTLDVDISGNVYVALRFSGTVDFDPGAGTTNLTSNGGDDVAIVKLDSSGSFVWVKRIGTTSSENVLSLSLDSNSYSYIAGYFYNTVDFDPGAGTTNKTSVGNDDLFMLKLDTDGDFVDVKQIGSASSESTIYLNTDVNNDVYLTGSFSGTVDFDPGAGTTDLTSNGGNDVFLVKMNSALETTWAKSLGGSGGDSGVALVVDGDSNVYLTGYFSNTVDFDPGAGTTNLTSNGADDVFIAKFDLSGELNWAKNFGNANDSEFSYGISLDSLNSVYITGYFYNTVDFDPGAGTTNKTSVGNDDLFMLKLDTDGAFSLVRTVGGTGGESGLAINVSSDSDIYLLGYFDSQTDFDPGAGTTSVTPVSGYDTFVLKLTSAGDSIPPTLTETTPISASADSTPDYTFNTNEAGTITYGGDCSSSTTSASVGNNTVTFNYLAPGSHNNCTITVTDASNNASTALSVSSFEIVVHGGGGGLVYQPIVTPVANTPVVSNLIEVVIIDSDISKEELIITNTCAILPNLPNILKYRDNNSTVKLLQQILNCKGYTVSTTGPGSKDKETTLFASKTKEAVLKFQKDKGIKVDGVVGVETRGELNK